MNNLNPLNNLINNFNIALNNKPLENVNSAQTQAQVLNTTPKPQNENANTPSKVEKPVILNAENFKMENETVQKYIKSLLEFG